MNKSKSNLVEMTQQCGSSIHRSLLVIALINLLGACGGATDTTADALTDLTSANQLTDAPQFTSKSAAAPTTDLLTTPSSNTPASSNASSAATNNSRAAAPVGSVPNPFATTPSTTNTSTNSQTNDQTNTSTVASTAPKTSATSIPLSSKTISAPPSPVVDNSPLDFFHEGPIPEQFDLSRGLIANVSSLKAVNTSNALYKSYFSDGVNMFRLISQNGNNDFYPVRQRFYNGFDEYQVVQELFGIYQDWSSMTLLSPAAPTISSYVTLKQQIFRYETDFLDNRIDLDTRISHDGSKSLRFLAVKPTSTRPLTKTSIDNENLLVRKNTLANITAWYYIAEGNPTGLMDLECEFISESPGIRLLLNDQLEPRVEMKWGNKTTFRVSPNLGTKLPRNQWFKLRLNLAVTDNNNGIVQLYVNNQLVIDGRGQTLFSTDGFYNRLQVGVTANTANSNSVVYMDEINYNSQQN